MWAGPTKATEQPTGTRYCIADGAAAPTKVPLADADVVRAAQTELATITFAAPQPSLNPAPTTLVNLPTILAADAADAKAETFDRTLVGVPVTLNATPTYHWVLPDATPATIDTGEPGRAYDGTDPAKDPGHYITATWATTGSRSVTLTVDWAVAVTRHDTGVTLTLAQPVEETGAVRVVVKQSRAVLTGNS